MNVKINGKKRLNFGYHESSKPCWRLNNEISRAMSEKMCENNSCRRDIISWYSCCKLIIPRTLKQLNLERTLLCSIR